MSSYLSERHSRSMNTLSIQRPRPSIEIWMPAAARLLVKAVEVNCEPWSVLKISGVPKRVFLIVPVYHDGNDSAPTNRPVPNPGSTSINPAGTPPARLNFLQSPHPKG